MVAIVDYGVGNLFSLASSFKAVGAEVTVTSDPAVLRTAERIVLPGVGAFGDAAAKLRESGLDQVVIEQAKAGKPLLGICLGMQLLFEKSFEYGEHEGLGLIKGEIDIAALPTNVASVLYNKTGGKVLVAAVNTKGVLYLLENGATVKSFADLKGKTVHLPGQGSNPEYIFRYLAEKNGLEIGKDVMVDYTYSSPDELATAIMTGLVSLAVLPEPKVTSIKSQNNAIRSALDFTVEWDKVSDGELVQGCIVVQKSFAEEHPAELAQFLKDYEASINFVNTNAEEASTMIEAAGIIPKAALAKKALPACNICYMAGEEMKASLNSFYKVLFDMAPASIGGAMPDDGIYYLP